LQLLTLNALIRSNDHFFRALKQALPKQRLDGVVAFNRIPHVDLYFAADPCYVERVKHRSFLYKCSPRHRYYKGLEGALFSSANPPDILVLTNQAIDAFHRHYGIARDTFHLLLPGVAKNTTDQATAASRRTLLRAELGTAADAVVALFVGSGYRIKGLDRALRAIAANRASTQHLEFWVIGNGWKKNSLSLPNKTYTAAIRPLPK